MPKKFIVVFKIHLSLVNINCIDQDKQLYVMGSREKGKSGLGSKTRGDIETPEMIKNLPPIEQVSCGRYFCLALGENQQVYSWGNNSYGQLGHSEKYMETKPIEIKSLSKKNIVKVSSGENFALALSNNGSIYSWGANSVGQLGQNHKSDLKTPRKIELNKKSVDIASGGNHSIILTGILFCL